MSSTAVRPRPTPSPRAVIGGAAATLLVVVVGLVAYVTSPAHGLHDPDHALQQLDLLYLDEPPRPPTGCGSRRASPPWSWSARAASRRRWTRRSG